MVIFLPAIELCQESAVSQNKILEIAEDDQCLDIEAECRDDFMKLRVAFNDSFTGLIYSAGKRPLMRLNFSHFKQLIVNPTVG